MEKLCCQDCLLYRTKYCLATSIVLQSPHDKELHKIYLCPILNKIYRRDPIIN